MDSKRRADATLESAQKRPCAGTKTWTGYDVKTLLGPEQLGPDDRERLANSLFQRTPIEFCPELSSFGNAQGLRMAALLESLVEKVAAQEEKLQSYGEELERLRPWSEDLLRVRAAVLERWWQTTNNDTERQTIRFARNATVHGGNLLADHGAIQRMAGSTRPEDQSKATRWRGAFTSQYGISYSLVKDFLDGAPTEVIESLNIRTNIKNLRSWAQSTDPSILETRTTILQCCDSVIDNWMHSLEKGIPVEDRALMPEKTKESFREARLLYDRGVLVLCDADEEEIA